MPEDTSTTVDATVAKGVGRLRLFGRINGNIPPPSPSPFAGARRDAGEDTGHTVDATVAWFMVGLGS